MYMKLKNPEMTVIKLTLKFLNIRIRSMCVSYELINGIISTMKQNGFGKIFDY